MEITFSMCGNAPESPHSRHCRILRSVRRMPEQEALRSATAMLEKEGINISVNALIEGGETPKSILNNTMKDMQVLDLTGCNIEEVLYYVSCGSPVFSMTGSTDAVLIIGYDSNSVVIFDPALGTTYRKTLTEADEMFTAAGNVFFTYLVK